MDQHNSLTNDSGAAVVTDPLAQATPVLADALKTLAAQFESLHAKIDLIVAAVDENALQLKAGTVPDQDLRNKVTDLEKSNQNLKAEADRARRKTLSPLVTSLLAKGGVEGDALIEAPVVEKALAGLSIEQRIAVKAELARAGVLV
jgi:hypothetical protein